ncbi:hypothetical protein [Pararhizobium sp.]|uniref:hypothetical protein n=1 Tax=Pararhizobium sp. TaxID=1977563 RepID=UPI0027258819|nr:hypothetical protein [Pararhizobium sp.]MDO9418400.1 hypothetical protein [Pararhizobium sp.]
MHDQSFIAPSLASRNERLGAIQRRIDLLRPQLLWSVDALIPADPAFAMPSASEAMVLDVHLPEALLLRDDMQEAFFAVIERLPAAVPDNGLGALEALGPTDFDLFCRIVAGAFFLDRAVNTRLGYTAQQAITETPDYDHLMDAIAPVMERGEIYTKI